MGYGLNKNFILIDSENDCIREFVQILAAGLLEIDRIMMWVGMYFTDGLIQLIEKS